MRHKSAAVSADKRGARVGEWWFELAFAIADAAAMGDTETLHCISEQLDEILEEMPERAAKPGVLLGDLPTLHFGLGRLLPPTRGSEVRPSR